MIRNAAIFRAARRRIGTLGAAGTAALAVLLASLAAGAQAAPPPLPAAGHPVLIRDQFGAPHIYAAGETDGYFALGYAAAQDRLEQILLLYKAARGELAASFGPGALGADKVGPALGGVIADTVQSDMDARRFGYLDAARVTFPQLPATYRANLSAYIAGISAFMAEHPERRPAWAPVLDPAMPLAVFAQLVGEAKAICPGRIADAAMGATSQKKPKGAEGSNAWAVGPSRTADGGVLFSSDSHGGWQAIGTLFYHWRMKAGDIDVEAFDPAGSAMAMFGHSSQYAWGWTEAPRYSGDCYRIVTDRKDRLSYTVDGAVRRFESIPYRIEVRGKSAVMGTFEYALINGQRAPVVTREGTAAYAVAYAGAYRVGQGHGQLYALLKARDKAGVVAALKPMDLYPANLIVAGRDHTLLYIRPGRTPKRAPGLDLKLPLDGNTDATAWRGFVSYDEAVRIENPPEDYLTNNNSSPDRMFAAPRLKPEDWAQHFAFDPGQQTTRQARAIELLGSARGLTDSGAIDIALDEKVPGLEKFAPMFAKLRMQGAWTTGDPRLTGFVNELATFDGVLARDSKAALAFMAVGLVLQQSGPKDKFEALINAVLDGRALTTDQEARLVAAVRSASDYLKQNFPKAMPSYGDVFRTGVSPSTLPVGGGGFIIGGSYPSLDLFGSIERGPHEISAMRAMTFAPDSANPKLLVASCCQRIPFVVAFHADGSTKAYAQFIPGISMAPGSAHTADQFRLASDRRMPSTNFNLAELLANEESRQVLTVTP